MCLYLLFCSEWLPSNILLIIEVTVEWHGLELLLLVIHTVKLRRLVEHWLRHKRVVRAKGCWLLLCLLKSISLLILLLDAKVRRLKLGFEAIVWRLKFEIPASFVLLARSQSHVIHC